MRIIEHPDSPELPEPRRRAPRPSALAAIAFAAATALGAEASALQPLPDFVRAADADTPERREAILLAEQREAEAAQSWGRLLPAFIARGTYTRNQRAIEIALPAGPPGSGAPAGGGRIVILPENQYEALLQLEVPLVDVGRWRGVDAANAAAAAARARAAATRLEVERVVAERYYQVVAAEALEGAARRTLAAAQENERIAKARVGAGVSTILETDRALAETERAKQSIADAELLSAVARRALASLTRLRPTAGAPALPDDLREEAPLRVWEARSVENLPAVRAAQAETRAVAAQADVARSLLLPTVTGNATERITNATGFQGQNAFWTLSLIATLRLDVASVQGVRAAAKAAGAARAREERVRRVARDQIHDAWQRVHAQIAKSRAARAQAKAAERAAQIARERYQSGAATQLDVIQADRDAFASDVARIQADADLAYARALLRLSAGAPLKTDARPGAEPSAAR